MTTPIRQLDRDLLRRAGEHLGALAQEAHDRMILKRGYRTMEYQVWVKLDRASREVLEIANA